MEYNIPQINEYINTVKIDKSPHTLICYTTAINKMISFLKIETFEDIKKLTSSDIRSHQSNMRETGLQPSSVNSNMRPLKAMFNWLVENEYLEASPTSKVKDLKAPKKLIAFLTEEEIAVMVSACKNILDKLIIVLLITTGLRSNELLSLKLSDVVGCHIIVNGKGSKQRKLILQPDVCDLLNEWIKKRSKKYGDVSDYLLVSKARGRFAANSLREKIRTIMRNGGILRNVLKQIHTHSLRHTFVANLFESGADIFTAQSALGHQNLATTQIYAHLRNSALDRAMLNQNLYYRGHMDKVKAFEKELIYIKNPKIKEFTEKAIESLPDYFFHISASSTNKYHPQYAMGDGGLLRHVRACVRVAVELFRMHMFYSYFTEDGMDLILSSLILHDGYKQGDGHTNHTVTEHPILASFAIRDNKELDGIIPDVFRKTIEDNIKTHMGAWVFDTKTGNKVLDAPEGRMQNFVHLVDYIASRKCLEMNFEVELSKG